MQHPFKQLFSLAISLILLLLSLTCFFAFKVDLKVFLFPSFLSQSLPLRVSSSPSPLSLANLLSLFSASAHVLSLSLSPSPPLPPQVPEVIIIPSNEGHWFNCSGRSLTAEETIESISWLKDDQVFYTYTALDDKVHVKLQPDRGVTGIDDTSTGGCVKLTNINVNSSGCFKCEVKLTDGRAKVMGDRSTAIYLAHEEGGIPSIAVFPSVHLTEGLVSSLQVKPLVVRTIGDTIGIKCRAQPSNPAAQVQIKVNNVRRDNLQYEMLDVSMETIHEPIDALPYANILYSTVLTAKFIITPEMVHNGFMLISCTSMVTSTHGFLESQDSETIRVRVVKPIQAVYENAVLERQKYFFVSIISLVAVALAVHQICSLVTRVSKGGEDTSVQRSA